MVVGVDLEPVDRPRVDGNVLERMTILQMPVLDYDFPPGKFDAAVLTRLIQYLPLESVYDLFIKVNRTLVDVGSIVLSYTAEGGILSRAEE